MSLTELVGDVDDFCKVFLPRRESQLLGQRQRQRRFTMSRSEVMTIIIPFHRSHYRDFKNSYLTHVGAFLRPAFPKWSVIIAGLN